MNVYFVFRYVAIWGKNNMIAFMNIIIIFLAGIFVVVILRCFVSPLGKNTAVGVLRLKKIVKFK